MVRRRFVAAPSSFGARLPAAASDLAQQLVRGPYLVDFLDLTRKFAELHLEAALMTRMKLFLLKRGHKFALAGRPPPGALSPTTPTPLCPS